MLHCQVCLFNQPAYFGQYNWLVVFEYLEVTDNGTRSNLGSLSGPIRITVFNNGDVEAIVFEQLRVTGFIDSNGRARLFWQDDCLLNGFNCSEKTKILIRFRSADGTSSSIVAEGFLSNASSCVNAGERSQRYKFIG